MIVESTGGSEVGRIAITSPSLFDRYTQEPDPKPRDRIVTEDLGLVVDGELYVLGRADDLYKCSGASVFAHEIERSAETINGIRPGSAAAALDASGKVVLIAEVQRDNLLPSLGRSVRATVLRLTGAALDEVVLCAPGTTRKTSSGKVRRRDTLSAVRGEDAEVLYTSI